MSISEDFLDISLKVRECEVKIEAIEKSLDVVKMDDERKNSFKRWEIVIIVVVTLIASVLGAIMGKILPG